MNVQDLAMPFNMLYSHVELGPVVQLEHNFARTVVDRNNTLIQGEAYSGNTAHLYPFPSPSPAIIYAIDQNKKKMFIFTSTTTIRGSVKMGLKKGLMVLNAKGRTS